MHIHRLKCMHTHLHTHMEHTDTLHIDTYTCKHTHIHTYRPKCTHTHAYTHVSRHTLHSRMPPPQPPPRPLGPTPGPRTPPPPRPTHAVPAPAEGIESCRGRVEPRRARLAPLLGPLPPSPAPAPRPPGRCEQHTGPGSATSGPAKPRPEVPGAFWERTASLCRGGESRAERSGFVIVGSSPAPARWRSRLGCAGSELCAAVRGRPASSFPVEHPGTGAQSQTSLPGVFAAPGSAWAHLSSSRAARAGPTWCHQCVPLCLSYSPSSNISRILRHTVSGHSGTGLAFGQWVTSVVFSILNNSMILPHPPAASGPEVVSTIPLLQRETRLPQHLVQRKAGPASPCFP